MPGLRRQEVADLAAVSLDYDTQLERGHVRGACDVVLTALMDALRLSAIERGYFLDLVRQVNASGRPPRHGARADMPPGLQQMADAMAEVTVLVRNHRMDAIGGNARA